MMDNLLPPLWMLLGSILGLACVVALVGGIGLLAISVLRRVSRRATVAPVSTGRPTDKETLQTQYARGEVAREKHEHMKQDLE